MSKAISPSWKSRARIEGCEPRIDRHRSSPAKSRNCWSKYLFCWPAYVAKCRQKSEVGMTIFGLGLTCWRKFVRFIDVSWIGVTFSCHNYLDNIVQSYFWNRNRSRDGVAVHSASVCSGTKYDYDVTDAVLFREASEVSPTSLPFNTLLLKSFGFL